MVFVRKDCLAPVGVASPFVERQYAREIMQVLHFSQLFLWQQIVQSHTARIDRIARPELQPGLAGNSRARQFHGQLRRQPDQFL